MRFGDVEEGLMINNLILRFIVISFDLAHLPYGTSLEEKLYYQGYSASLYYIHPFHPNSSIHI